MAQTTFKNIQIGDSFATATGYLGTVQDLTLIKEALRERVEVKTEHGREVHAVNETVFLLHEAGRRGNGAA